MKIRVRNYFPSEPSWWLLRRLHRPRALRNASVALVIPPIPRHTHTLAHRPSKNQKTLLFCFQVIIYIRNTEFHANDAIHPNTGIRGTCRLTRRLHAAPGTPGTAVVGSRASYLWEIITGSIPVDSLDTRGDEAAPIEPH